LNAQTKTAAPDPIADAIESLRSQEKKVAEANAALAPLDKAIAKARTLVAEKADTIKRIAELRGQRRAFLADELLGKPDTAKISTVDRELEVVEVKFKKIAPIADDAESALIELERRRAQAASPIIKLSENLPGLRANVLAEVARMLLDEYGEALDTAFSRYLEVVALVPDINRHGRAAGLAPVLPEGPGTLDYPGIALGDKWRASHTMGANQKEMGEARERLAKKLAELGVQV
jgi:hypothetical protein